LLDQGFEAAVVKDAMGAPRHPELGDGYKSAFFHFGCIAKMSGTSVGAGRTRTSSPRSSKHRGANIQMR
jgi:hypothetical protein